MRIIKAEVLGHLDSKGNRCAIYSMDVQPNSNRLATGGGDNAKEALLATLSSHTKSVNVVRWSRDGKLLASGSDDNYILVHKFTPGALSNQAFGSVGAVRNKETWSRCFTLQGHSMDVVDLDWLPGSVEHGYTLASASVDNRIMIWGLTAVLNSNGHAASSTLVSPRQILSGHDSFVKGLSYDPMGRYLISSGSDNRLIVWDTQADYAAVRTLDEPLRNSPDKTIFRRISWAPDGQSVCVTSAQKSSKPVGMVLKRGTWESVADLVGHASCSISAKFCPHVLQYANNSADSGNNSSSSSSGKPAVACTVALGDQNGVVSVWSTHSNRPLYVLRDVCDGAVTDMAWARSASLTAVAMCGIDGTVMIADFEGEIGRCLPPAVLERHFQTLYGRNASEMQQRPQALVESALALKYAQTAAQLASAPAAAAASAQVAGSPMTAMAQRGTAAGAGPAVGSSAAAVQMQQTTQIIGGKKRIRPVLMANNLDTPDEVTAAVVSGGLSVAPPLTTPAPTVTASAAITAAPQIAARSVSFPLLPAMDTQHADSGMDGAGTASDSGVGKRMRPEAVGNSSSSNGLGGSASVFAAANSSVLVPAATASAAAPSVPRSSGATTPVQGGRNTGPTERFLTIQFNADETLCTVPLLNSQQRLRRAVATTGASGSGSAGSNGGFVVSAQRLTKPSVLAQLRHSGGPLSAITLSPIRQDPSSANGDSAAVPVLWTAVVAGEATCIAATDCTPPSSSGNSGVQQQVEGVLLVGCADGTLHCLALASGVRMGPPIVLGCAVAHVDIRAHINITNRGSSHPGSEKVDLTALAVTADGELWKWRLDPATLKFRCEVRTTIRPVLLSMKSQVTALRAGDKSSRGGSGSGPTTARAGSNGGDRDRGVRNGASSKSGGEEEAQNPPKSTPGPSFVVQQCLLSDRGDIQVHVQATAATVTIAEGGAWQAFQYDADAMTWQRLSDMRYVLSSLFAVKGPAAQSAASPIVYADATHGTSGGAVAGTESTASLSALQGLAAAGAQFGPRDVVSIAAAKQAALHAAMTSAVSTGTGSGPSGAAVGSGKTAPTAEEWVSLVTISHVEDRLAVAQALGSAAEVEVWLSAWIETCCKNGLNGRLRWLVMQLLAQHSHRNHKGGDSTANRQSPSEARRGCCWAWLGTVERPLELLQSRVMPVIAKFPAAHALLAEISHTLELLSLV